jgi:tRNA A64-2'-O-ribosylphosphate transferase
VLVDSTRAGKRIPDALSKTVPIWCAVINRAVAKVASSTIPDGWDINLYTPPQVVSTQEHAQIEARLDSWADALAVRSLRIFYCSNLIFRYRLPLSSFLTFPIRSDLFG